MKGRESNVLKTKNGMYGKICVTYKENHGEKQSSSHEDREQK